MYLSKMSSADSSEAPGASPLQKMADTSAVDELVDEVYGTVKSGFRSRVTPDNVVVLITEAMMAVERIQQSYEKFHALSGPAKKDVVLEVLERLVSELPVGRAEKDAIVSAVNLLAPSVIDTIVSASKGQFDLNATVERAGACCRKLFPCF